MKLFWFTIICCLLIAVSTEEIRVGFMDFSEQFREERAWAIMWATDVAKEEGLLQGFNFRYQF